MTSSYLPKLKADNMTIQTIKEIINYFYKNKWDGH